jgi:hypothetical protein
VRLNKFYIDEDAMDTDLVEAIRSRGLIVMTVTEAGLTGLADEQQLAFAAKQECVLYTYNVADFCRLHTEWLTSGREHAGLLLGVTTTLLRGGTTSPHSAPSSSHQRGGDAQPCRVSRQLGLTLTGAGRRPKVLTLTFTPTSVVECLRVNEASQNANR